MEQALPSGGVVLRMLAAWADLRASMRTELARGPSEGRLLFYAMFAGFLWFLGQAAGLAYGDVAPVLPGAELRARIGWEFVTAVLFLPLVYYGLAALGGAVARAFGGTGDWRSSRAATFWAALVAAPVILAFKLLAIVAAGLPGGIAEATQILGKLAFGWALAQCFAEAHGFSSGLRVLAVIAALVALFMGAAYGLRFL